MWPVNLLEGKENPTQIDFARAIGGRRSRFRIAPPSLRNNFAALPLWNI
jgi:hypothetical protein